MEPFIGQIMMFGGNFAPRGWAFCDGQLMSISQNDVLFSLLGTIYGGDGRTTFALPDLRGRTPVGFGQSAGTSEYRQGASFGHESVTLTAKEMPAHTHALQAMNTAAVSPSPNQQAVAKDGLKLYNDAQGPELDMSPAAIGNVGGGQSHYNMMPYLCVNFCIALQGIFPPRH